MATQLETKNLRKDVTLWRVWQDFREVRGGRLKPRTIYQYEYFITHYLADWAHRSITHITKDDVEQRHKHISLKHGPTQANNVFRALSALLNFARDKFEVDGEPIIMHNPVRRLSNIRAWNRESVRQTYLKPHELKPFFRAVLAHENTIIRDALTVLALTGLRKAECLSLRWDCISFEDRTLTVLNTKNHRDHVLPVPNFLYGVLKRRREQDPTGVYVFQYNGTHVNVAKDISSTIKARSRIKFSPHDLRRTFASIANELDISPFVIKRLLNHVDQDITRRYVCLSMQQLRSSMQSIEDYILTNGGLSEKQAAKTRVKMTVAQAKAGLAAGLTSGAMK